MGFLANGLTFQMSRFQEVAEQYLTIKFRGPIEFMCECPLCGGGASLQFNIEKGLWTCFRCSEGGSAKKLVQRIGGQYIEPGVSSELLRMQFDRLRTNLRRKDREEEDSGDTGVSEHTLLRYQGPDHPYW